MLKRNILPALALALIALFVGCNKEPVQRETKNSISKASITTEEAEEILDDVSNFFVYARALSTDPRATTTDFPSYISTDEAVSLLENTYNYYFARIDYSLAVKDEHHVAAGIAVNGEGWFLLKT